MSKSSELLTCKRILIFIYFLGFMFHHMLRVNISMAIIDMITNNTTNTSKTQRFDWNEQQKNDILGCFFWGYTVASLMSGHLSEVYGTRIVLGSGFVLATISTLLTPAASYLSYSCLIVLRIVVGLGLGLHWSSGMPLATRWVPLTDISKFLSTMVGSQLGAALTVILCGYLVDWFGWPSAFYVTGIIAGIWCFAWFYWVYDSPRQHPRISAKEKEQLQRKVKYQISTVAAKKPWAKIFTSRPVWAIILAYSCVLFNAHSAINYIPLYMDQILHFQVSNNGLLSSLPFIVTYLTSVLSSYLADKWTKSNYLSLLTIRKVFTIGAMCISVLALIVQSIWGYNYFVSVVIFIVWQSITGCHTGGCMPNVMDISPNYSGTIFSLSSAVGSLLGYLSTKLVAILTENEKSFQQWKIFFWILIGVNVVGAVIYCIFASAEVQEWNNGSQRIEMEGECENKIELCGINAK